MSIDLRAAAAEHLRARRARGYRLADHDRLLASFLDGLAAHGTTTITVVDAVAFAVARTRAERSWQATRLSAIRAFAVHVHALDPAAAQLIPAGLITSTTARRIPYLYSTEQIDQLMSRASALTPSWLAAAMQALIGLIAATGIRSGEAVALNVEDLHHDQALLTVTGKYGRQRLVPIHQSTVQALLAYQQLRAALTPAASTGPLLVGCTGKRLNITSARAAFRRVADQCDLPTSPGRRPPRLHDLRHTFAVNTLIDAHRHGVDVDARIAVLATYLGHVNPLNTYWYLSASAELMTLVSDRMTTHRQGPRP